MEVLSSVIAKASGAPATDTNTAAIIATVHFPKILRIIIIFPPMKEYAIMLT